jgi:hypothetical protein
LMGGDPNPSRGAGASAGALPSSHLPAPVDSLHFQGQEPDALVTE